MTHILLIRHGIPEVEQPGQSDADRRLTPEGRACLREVLAALVQNGLVPTHAISSPYRRAVETMAILQDVAGTALPVENWDELVPHGDPGIAEQCLRAAAAEASPHAVLALTGHQPMTGALAFRLTGHRVSVGRGDCLVLAWSGGSFRFIAHHVARTSCETGEGDQGIFKAPL